MDLSSTTDPTDRPAPTADDGGEDHGSAMEGQSAGEPLQFVTFMVADEAYAVDIMQVREIKAWSEVTRLPNQPEHMRGVLNLRGVIVPIFDLRCRFGQGLTEATAIHVVVIVAVAERIVGILVDTVSDILTVSSDEVRPVPELESRGDRDFLEGLASAGERMVALLNLDELFDLSLADAELQAATA